MAKGSLSLDKLVKGIAEDVWVTLKILQGANRRHSCIAMAAGSRGAVPEAGRDSPEIAGPTGPQHLHEWQSVGVSHDVAPGQGRSGVAGVPAGEGSGEGERAGAGPQAAPPGNVDACPAGPIKDPKLALTVDVGATAGCRSWAEGLRQITEPVSAEPTAEDEAHAPLPDNGSGTGAGPGNGTDTGARSEGPIEQEVQSTAATGPLEGPEAEGPQSEGNDVAALPPDGGGRATPERSERGWLQEGGNAVCTQALEGAGQGPDVALGAGGARAQGSVNDEGAGDAAQEHERERAQSLSGGGVDEPGSWQSAQPHGAGPAEALHILAAVVAAAAAAAGGDCPVGPWALNLTPPPEAVVASSSSASLSSFLAPEHICHIHLQIQPLECGLQRRPGPKWWVMVMEGRRLLREDWATQSKPLHWPQLRQLGPGGVLLESDAGIFSDDRYRCLCRSLPPEAM